MKQLHKLLAILLCIALLWSCGSEPTDAERTAEGCRQLLGIDGALLERSELPAGSSVSDWLAMSLTLAGVEDAQSSYLQRLTDYVTQKYADQGTLDTYKATEFHRIAMTVRALGGDPADLGSEHIDLIADGVTAYAGDLGAQGLNGLIFALLTLDCGGYGSDAQRQELVSRILEAQEPDGSFGLVEGSGSVDITAMALQALAPYGGQCGAEIDAALSWLSSQLSPRCTFMAFDAESSESVSQTIIALCALGIDPATDSRFCRGTDSLLTALQSFRTADGAYRHSPQDNEGSLMATEQALLAQTALERLKSGRLLYDFR